MASFIKRFIKGFIRVIWINATHNVDTADVPQNTNGTYKHVDMCDVGFRDNNNRKIGYVGSDIVMRKPEGSEEYKRCVLTYMQALGDASDTSKQTTFAIVCSLDGTIKQIETNTSLGGVQLNWCKTNLIPYDDAHIASKKYVDDKAGLTVIESGSNVNGRYRKWSDGTIEQWGVGNADGRVRNLPISFPDTNYMILVTPQNYGLGDSFGTKSRTVSSFVPCMGWDCSRSHVESNAGVAIFWYARSL